MRNQVAAHTEGVISTGGYVKKPSLFGSFLQAGMGLATALMLLFGDAFAQAPAHVAPAFAVATKDLDAPPPAWAYPTADPGYKEPPDDGRVLHVAGSAGSWTLTQTRDAFFATDWHPEEHPQMPGVVARGRKPTVWACGYCHRADGPGGPENAGLAGLPEKYILEQLAEFKSGARMSAFPLKSHATVMPSIAAALTEEEVAESAAYFSSLKPRKLITVKETERVPKTYVAGFVFAAVEGGGEEAMGNRIIEMPKDLEQFESRDTHSEFIAYVPVGSIAQGRELATTGGNGRTLPCGTCHGADLRGVGAVPGIAGRSPSYLVRQLYDMQHGLRAGTGSALMAPVVAKLTHEDYVRLAAYAASLTP
jgi:cytochrome c553